MKFTRLLVLIATSLVASIAYASSWQIVSSPSVGSALNQLSGVSAAGDSDVWAVGANIPAHSSGWVPLVEHWDGNKWSIVQTPILPRGTNLLNGVTVVASNDVWAVGQASAGGLSSTLIEHWDGTSWSVVPSPNVAGFSNYLRSVAVVAPDDIWAVGDILGNGVFPLALHWDGTAWSIVPTPNQEDSLNAVAIVASDDVWAVGVNVQLENPVAMHWNGTQWAVVPTPSFEDSGLSSLAVISSTDLWAGGNDTSTATLTLHWDGTAFRTVADPSFQYPLNNGVFLGMTALASNNVWAAGQILNGSTNQALIEHWDGRSWKISKAPISREATSQLSAIAATPNGTLWAVGSAATSLGQSPRTFILRMTP